jgi:hypothetical protein
MPQFTPEQSKNMDTARRIIDNLPSVQLPDGTVILFVQDYIQVYLPDNSRVVYRIDYAFQDKVS